ncbi:Protein TolB [Candidatus Methylomirabilis lanthanidiphila]|uniref:Protein TolB n=1 Tax=Candidatus Methylomirabilis lanthanidiphila TaxID=2211376 RepID=A0A564ZK81_9BACT|nr:hypothetical protein [Candidatus Methylomirabilis lanthanidiphila]VUZ85735.1 Protein TolB [Candidatus Methylomirabilis lanthanidiphila]
MQPRKIYTLCGFMAVMILSAGCATTPSKVAYIISDDQGTTSVLIQNADGSKSVRVPGLSGAISEVVMSPSGQRLAYVTGGTTGGLDQVFAIDLDENNNIIGVRRNVSDELPTARSFSPKFFDDDHLLYLSENQGSRVLVLADLRTGGKQKISAISGSIDTVVRYNVDSKNALFFGLNKELRRFDLPTGPLRSVVANTGSASELAYEKMGIFENTAVFSVQVTPKERAVSHMRLDGTELKAVPEVPSELIFPLVRLASDPAARVHRFSLFDFTLVMRPQEKEAPPAADLITLEGYEVTAQKITERHLVWVVRDLRSPNLVRAVYAAKGLEDLRTGAYEGSVYLASTRDLLVWYDPAGKKIWGVPLGQIGGNPVDLSVGVTRVANHPFSVSANNIGVVTEDGKLYLLSTNRTSSPRLLGQGIRVNITRP